MLTFLSIKNFALVKNSEISFSDNLNMITGETGSGKSIIIQALAILLGARASIEQIRTGENEAVLNATISVENNPEAAKLLSQSGISIEDDEIILRRVLLRTGKSRSFINGTQVTSKELAKISSMLFDFHGQHDGISLLKKHTHIKYLDNYIGLAPQIGELSGVYYKLKELQQKLASLSTEEEERIKRLELLEYEIEEIESAELKSGEDGELLKKIKLLENMERIIEITREAHNVFGGENGIVTKLDAGRNLISQVSELDSSFKNGLSVVEDAYYKLEDFYSDLSHKMSEYQYDSGELDELIERNELINKLKRKYGASFNEIMAYLENAKKEKNKIEFSDKYKNEISVKISELKEQYIQLAVEISNKRKEGKVLLENSVKDKLSNLGMVDVNFDISVECKEIEDGDFIEVDGKNVKYLPVGIDDVEFLISPNKGEPLKSLIKIASGGELSRIILSLKTILANNDLVQTMIFDEIDVGIGGKVALAVSTSLKDLAKSKQIICITHLPQIAAAGDKNFEIAKATKDERTVTSIVELDEENKVNEIARMLSGHITETSLEHARELIGR